MRHDRIRDVEASLLKDICKDVRTEPELLPVETTGVGSSTTAEKARLDVSAVGIWSPMEKTFVDVRVFHPNAASHKDTSIYQLYNEQETEKKKKYGQRIVQVERASFTPLVFSTMGGMAPECARYHNKVALLIANKTNEEYSKVVNHIRTRMRFTLLKSTLLAVRGYRGKPKRQQSVNVTELNFNTMPKMPSYEV